jgi:hypothetical protein
MNKDLKIIVYSANIGGYDKPSELTSYDKNIEYIYFTDNTNFTSEIWNIKPIDFVNPKLDNRRKSRFLKLNPHIVLPEHDISIWMDGSLEPIFTSAHELLEKIGFGDNNIMCYKHRFRNCIYDECEEVLNWKLDFPALVVTQSTNYYNKGFPRNYGLYENGFMIRRNNDKMKKFNEFWWNEVSKNSARDQLSQMYSCWVTKTNILPITVGKNVEENEFLIKKNHELAIKIN